MALPFATIDRCVAAARSGAVTCRTIAERSLEVIRARNPDLRAFISVCEKHALERAEMLDALPWACKNRMPLFGVPVAVKDNICTRGITTTCASRMLENFVPPYDACVVEMLDQAGAIIVGKTNMDEFSMGSTGGTSYFGPVVNPRDHGRTPGGSSGGSAAAVASGMVISALGSDTGGSIRQPASHCGVVGLKPTYGRVSRYGLVAFASSLDQIGPLTSDVRDAGRMLEVISGPDARDSTCAGRKFVPSEHIYSEDIRNLKVGFSRGCFDEGLSEDVLKTVVEAERAMRDAGARIVDIALPLSRFAVAAYYVICTAEASSNLARFDGVKYGLRETASTPDEMYRETRGRGFGPEVKRRIMLGTYVLSAGYHDSWYLKAAKARTLIGKELAEAFGSCDVIMSPVAPAAPFKTGEIPREPLQVYLTDMFTVSANLAGIPGISVPCSKAGPPIGIQLTAPPWREDLLLKSGYALQCLVR